MRLWLRLRNRWRGIIDTVLRFPLTILLLAAAVITIAVGIQDGQLYDKLLISFFIGASVYTVYQLLYERFFTKTGVRYLFMGASILLSAVYYQYIVIAGINTETSVKTTVLLFILLIAFLWVPVIKSRVSFNDSFMASFKAFFMSIFLNGILFLGIALIFAATNRLLMKVSEEAYVHTANIIFVFFTPAYFLSLIPYYPGKEKLRKEESLKQGTTPEAEEAFKKEVPKKEEAIEKDGVIVKDGILNKVEVSVDNQKSPTINRYRQEALVKLTAPSKFLETLISYVVIPVTAVFTLILLLYIVANITGEFWTDNLMEPLLVIYSITVIIVYLLASTINKRFTRCFCLIFPKVLVPVVLFQTISSIFKTSDVGITYGRYYVILFGIFATIASILFSVRPIRKNGLIAPVLIILSVISIMPVTNAFTVSKSVQIVRLTQTLRKNEMLDKEAIIPNSGLSDKDKKTIISAIIYLDNMGYTKDIGWLSGYRQTDDFEQTFGFSIDGETQIPERTVTAVTRDKDEPIQVQGYDFITQMYDQNYGQKIKWNMDGDLYTLSLDSNEQTVILEKGNTEINSFALSEIYNKLTDVNAEDSLKTEDLTFLNSNESSTIAVVVEYLYRYIDSSGTNGDMTFYVLVDIK